MAILSASKLALSYSDVEIFSGIYLEIAENARIGIVGPNGSGKSSLLKVLVQELDPDPGTVHRARGVRWRTCGRIWPGSCSEGTTFSR
jgi:ATP-binding cassette subfamily F protein 3